ncbi:anthranilate synthase component II [Facilibium subflavum]|uniref:anthranilate synthase component II n=1 Tax=Facilibium subflavum TaxID=2219058 RepID=UPI000E65078A|nr:aminodeoxychorismate/anthranilate synthase component II [Facilibium subflavum]
MILYIDHYDSFTCILNDYFTQLGHKIDIVKTDKIDPLLPFEKYTHIVIGPGPGHPNELLPLYPAIDRFIASGLPILGVCLGHQLIAQYFGAKVIKAREIMHGQLSEVYQTLQTELYQQLPEHFTVTRYHSLIVDHQTLPDCLTPIASTQKNELMAFMHKQYKIYGIQYHPEAYLTAHGLKTLANFLHL